MSKETDSFWEELKKTNPLSLIIFYLIIYVFGTLMVSLIVSFVVSKINNLDFKEAYNLGMGSIKTDDIEFSNKIYYTVQAYTNVFSYFLLFIETTLIGRAYLKEDAKVFKDKKQILFIILAAVLFTAFNALTGQLSSYLVSKVSENTTSENETLIRNMITNGHQIPVGISIILFAPLVEELVYRKSIMELADKLHPVWQILISSVCFALPHMLSSTSYSFLPFIILTITYLLSGIALGVIYYIFKKNVYASLFAHALSNTFSFIMLL